MILKNADRGLTIFMEEDLLNSLVDIGIAHYPDEFGGFLVGNYGEDLRQVQITDCILPQKYKGTPYLFERDAGGIEEQLKEFYSQTPQKYYVGEWHTHPDGLPIPSATDVRAMRAISNHSEVAIKNPVLLIIGLQKTNTEFEFYITIENKLYKYEDC